MKLVKDPLHIVLAKLIFNRQKQRQETKLKYKVEPIEGWGIFRL